MTLLVVASFVLAVSCTKLARKKLEERDLAFDADTMVGVAEEGATGDVKLFLAAGMGPDVEGRTKDGGADITPLMGAVRGCHAEVARLLLDSGANAAWATKHEETLLHAVADGCADAPDETARELTAMLIDAGADIEARDPKHETPLLRAVERVNVGVVATLVEHGADIRASGRRGTSVLALTREARSNKPDKMKRQSEIERIVEQAAARARSEAASIPSNEARERLEAAHYKFDRDGLVAAASRDDVEAVQYFLTLDAPPEWRASALSAATRGKQQDAVELLLANGAKPDTETLLASVEAGDLAQLRRLVASGAKLDAQGESGSTVLIAASKKGWYEAVVLLLEAGASIDAPGRSGETPLLAAAGSPTVVSDARTVILLVSRGARVNVDSSSEITPAYLVALRGNAEALQALVDAGANVDTYRGHRGSVLSAALASQANSDRKMQTLAVLYRVVDGWNETERIDHAKDEISWVMNKTAVNGGGLNPGNRSARVTIGGSGPYDRIPDERLADLCHEIASSFGLGCCWLERIDAYSAGGTRLGAFRFDRARGWWFEPHR